MGLDLSTAANALASSKSGISLMFLKCLPRKETLAPRKAGDGDAKGLKDAGSETNANGARKLFESLSLRKQQRGPR